MLHKHWRNIRNAIFVSSQLKLNNYSDMALGMQKPGPHLLQREDLVYLFIRESLGHRTRAMLFVPDVVFACPVISNVFVIQVEWNLKESRVSAQTNHTGTGMIDG